MMKALKAFWASIFQLMEVVSTIISGTNELAKVFEDECKGIRKEADLERQAEVKRLQATLE